jgi:shikimate kinase
VNIYLYGMTGSGKSTLGARLSEKLGLPGYDEDIEIDRILNYSLNKFVEVNGWLAFREIEYSVCKNFAQQDGAVISLGGGTVRYEWNMDVLDGTGVFILIEAPLEEIIKRRCIERRPRVYPGLTVEQDLRKIWQIHKEKYYAAADIVYQPGTKSIEEEVEDLFHIVVTDNRFRELVKQIKLS